MSDENAKFDTVNENTDNANDSTVAETPENGGVSEDATAINGYQTVIDRQNGLIDTLMTQIESYQKQIETLVRNGAVIRDDQGKRENAALPGDFADNPTEHEDYIPLSDLGKEIGKHD